jgi:low affinity Fe/Cu permease
VISISDKQNIGISSVREITIFIIIIIQNLQRTDVFSLSSKYNKVVMSEITADSPYHSF